MEKKPRKVYGRKQILTIGGATMTGLVVAGIQRWQQKDRFTWVDGIGAVITIGMVIVITLVMSWWANKPE